MVNYHKVLNDIFIKTGILGILSILNMKLNEIKSGIKTIKLEISNWNKLKNLKKTDETFNDVIKELLDERTKSIGGNNIKAIKYGKKNLFLETEYKDKLIAVEFEYNDVKNEKEEFTLDLKIKKVFFGRKSFNPSVFFGVKDSKKHLNIVYLSIYLKCIAFALSKEFGVRVNMKIDEDFEEIAKWRKIYYDYGLSEESFIQDIEKVMNLNEEEKVEEEEKREIFESKSGSEWNIISKMGKFLIREKNRD